MFLCVNHVPLCNEKLSTFWKIIGPFILHFYLIAKFTIISPWPGQFYVVALIALGGRPGDDPWSAPHHGCVLNISTVDRNVFHWNKNITKRKKTFIIFGVGKKIGWIFLHFHFVAPPPPPLSYSFPYIFMLFCDHGIGKVMLFSVQGYDPSTQGYDSIITN